VRLFTFLRSKRCIIISRHLKKHVHCSGGFVFLDKMSMDDNTHPARDASLCSKINTYKSFSHLGEMRPKKGSIPRGFDIIILSMPFMGVRSSA